MTKNPYIDIVKRRLWASGYAVSERSREVDGFDLLVDARHRVIVERRVPNTFSPNADAIAVIGRMFDKWCVAYFAPFDLANKAKSVTMHEMFGLPTSKGKNHGKKNTKKAAPKGSGKEAQAT